MNVQKGYFDSYPSILGVEQELPFYIARKEELDHLEKAYRKMMDSLQLQQSTKTEFGTLSLVSKRTEYRLLDLYEEFGEELLLNHSEVSLTQLEELVLAGIISRGLVKSHQTITDIRLDLIIQSLESEQRAWDYQNKRKQELRNLLKAKV